MNRSQPGLLLTCSLLIALILSASAALAQIEDPSIYPGVWYRIAFDENGNRIQGDGDGYDGDWYYYPTADRHRMWFYNDPYDPDRKGYLNYEAYLKPLDPSQTSYAQIHFNWTTPEWSDLGHGRPPLPGDVPTMTEESEYMSGYHMHTVDNLRNFESIEPVRSHTIYSYNPEWISIDIVGRNVAVYRGAWHECREKNPSDPSGGDPDFRVCCRQSTGDCYVMFGGNCAEPYETLASGLTCDDCGKTPEPALDFGDAPDSDYATVLANDGARHVIVAGVFLGKSVDAEADAQPNNTATGDDDNGPDEDGVTFTSVLQPGWPARVEVMASTQGYLNAWIDFDGDGRFGGADEHVFVDVLLAAGTNQLTLDVPDDARVGTTFARFRFNSRGLLDYQGLASDGEVEDYTVDISTYYEPYPTSGATALRWNQPPSTIGAADPYLFEAVTALSALDQHQIVADDFQFEAGRPVTGIHWWGSFDGWTGSYLPAALPLAFHIGIWTDVPDAQPNDISTFGHPGTLVWESYCTHWSWALAGYQEASKGDILGATAFQFSCLLSQDEWFDPMSEPEQKETEATFYWISIAAIYDLANSGTAPTWGWMTRAHQFGETAAVVQEITPGPWPPSEGSAWLWGQPVENGGAVPWDTAFQLTTYGAPEATEKTESGHAEATPAVDLHRLALAATRWLDETP